MRFLRLLLLIAVALAPAAAQTPAKKPAGTPEQRTARYFESIKKDPLLLRAFLLSFPKGGDLHNHLSGAIYAESYIQWAAESGLCVNTQTFTYVTPKQPASPAADSEKNATTCGENQRPAGDALGDPVLYRSLIDALSMRNFDLSSGGGESHFFDSFVKFGLVSRNRMGEMVAEVARRAALQNEHYLELMVSLDGGIASRVADKTPWRDDLAAYRQQLMANGLGEAVAAAKAQLDSADKTMRQVLHCDTAEALPGCDVTVRYISQVARAGSKERVYAQTIAGFEMSKAEPRVVAVNFVQPEDWMVPVRDFDLHMQMLDYLHSQYPKVNIALHAGELTFGQVMPDVLGQHIPKSIAMGHAQRIGHGTDIMYNPDPAAVMKIMAQKKIAVEISLSSSEGILRILDEHHPFQLYRKAGVPVVIATDDEGVARSDITHEYQRAVEAYNLSYADIKKISMDSVEYSFLPGDEKTAAQQRLKQAFAIFEKSN